RASGIDERMRERRVLLEIAPFRDWAERRKRAFASNRRGGMTGDQLIDVLDSRDRLVERARELRRAAAVGRVDERRPLSREQVADGGHPARWKEHDRGRP